MKLKNLLKAMPSELLRGICEFWELTAPEETRPPSGGNHAALVDFLYPRMQAAGYFRSAFGKLGELHREVLVFLAVHGGELEVEEILPRCFSGDQAACQEAIAVLHRFGFVHIEGDGTPGCVIKVPDGLLAHLDLSPHLQGFLGNLLRGLSAQELAVLGVNLLGKLPKSVKRGELFHRVRKRLLDPAFLKSYTVALPEAEHDILGALVEKDGMCVYRELLELDSQRRFDFSRAEQLNSLLALKGLIFPVFEGANKYSNVLMIPRDILHVIRSGFAPDLRSFKELDALASSATDFRAAAVTDNTQMLLRDLALLASYIHTHGIRRLSSGGVSKADLKRSLAVLSADKGARYATFLAGFLVAGKHLIPVGAVWKVSDTFLDWLGEPLQVYRALYGWWLESNDWCETTAEGVTWSGEQRPAGLASLIEIRHQILDALSSAPVGKWVSYAAFEEMVLPRITASLAGTAAGGDDPGGRFPVKRVLHSILTEPLSWLGLVALGTRESTGKERLGLPGERPQGAKNETPDMRTGFAFRQTSLARVLFESGAIRPHDVFHEIPTEAFPVRFDAEWVIVQPNLEIIAPPDLKLPAIYCLAEFCDVRNVDVMTTLELTRESLRAALDRGTRETDIVDLLSRMSRTGLPETVKHLVSECSEKHGEAYVASAGGYILTEDSAVLEEIRSNPRFLPLIKDFIGDSAVVLAPDVDLSKLARELRAAGMMPRLESGTVHATRDERYHLSLTFHELYDLIGSVRLVRCVEDALAADITKGKAATLVQKLDPESATFFTLRDQTESTAATFEKRFRAALQKLVDGIEEKHKSQVSRLVTKSISSRSPSRFHYRGQNPAVEKVDIRELLAFAADYELEAEIQYVKQNDREVALTIYPKSFEGNRLYAYCVESDRDGMYSLERVLRAKLL